MELVPGSSKLGLGEQNREQERAAEKGPVFNLSKSLKGSQKSLNFKKFL